MAFAKNDKVGREWDRCKEGRKERESGDGLSWKTAINKLQMRENWQWQSERGEDICICQTQRDCVCVSLLYLSKSSLAVSNVVPVFASQAVRQFVLPDKCSVLSAGAALQPSCTLSNNTTHCLGHPKVHLQRRQAWFLLIGHFLHHKYQTPCLLCQLWFSLAISTRFSFASTIVAAIVDAVGNYCFGFFSKFYDTLSDTTWYIRSD